MDSRQSFAERLGAWLGWTDAIALSGVLNGGAGPGAEAQLSTPFSMALAVASANETPTMVANAQAARVRNELSRAINLDSTFLPPKPGLKSAPPMPAASVPASAQAAAASDWEADYLPYRRSYGRHQRAMGTRIASLRIDLRALMSQASPALGQLAALDAAMDEALGVHERGLLATVPQLLQKRFERLHREQPPVVASATAGQRAAPQPAWLQAFGKDMQAVLLAELELRMQPVEGLLEALAQPTARQAAQPARHLSVQPSPQPGPPARRPQ